MPSLELATRFIRPFTLMCSRSLGGKNIWPKVLYLVHASERHKQTIHMLSSCLVPTVGNPASVLSPSLNKWVLRFVWPLNSPSATLSFHLLSIPYLQVFHDAQVSVLKWLYLDPYSFSTTCILSHTRSDYVVDFASAAIAALLESTYVFSYSLSSLTRGVLRTSGLPSLQFETL